MSCTPFVATAALRPDDALAVAPGSGSVGAGAGGGSAGRLAGDPGPAPGGECRGPHTRTRRAGQAADGAARPAAHAPRGAAHDHALAGRARTDHQLPCESCGQGRSPRGAGGWHGGRTRHLCAAGQPFGALSQCGCPASGWWSLAERRVPAYRQPAPAGIPVQLAGAQRHGSSGGQCAIRGGGRCGEAGQRHARFVAGQF